MLSPPGPLAGVGGWGWGPHAVGGCRHPSRARRVWSSARSLAGVTGALVRASPRFAVGTMLFGAGVGVGGYHLGPACSALLAGRSAGVLALGGAWLVPFAGLLFLPKPEDI
jgi:hypothetical protein